jgi:putative ABC transport system permease protein
VAVVTLAIGLGVNAGLFTVVNAVLFRNVPAPRAHELVSIAQTVAGVEELAGQEAFSTSEYFAYRDGAQTLSQLAAYGNARGEATLGGDVPRKVLGMLVSCNYFAVLEQPPVLGRAFATRDCQPGADLVVVLSHQLWTTAFGSDPGIVGRAIRLSRQSATVVGVAAEGAYNGSPFLAGGYFAPLNAGRALAATDSRYDDGNALWLSMVGRRSGGADLEQVRAELDSVASRIDQQQPGRSTALTIERATPGLPRQLRNTATAAAAVLMAAFGVILLMACANVANLLLARGMSRSQEIGVRVALGASRARVVRQLLTESLLMALAGGLLGTLVALWAFQALVALAVPALLPPWAPLTLTLDLSPDMRVLTFAFTLTLATGVLFGLAPAVFLSTSDVHALMKHDAGAVGSRRGRRLRTALVGAQVALCVVLMVAAGLLLRGLYAAYTIDPGFEYRDVTYVSLESAFDGYSPEQAQVMQRRLTDALAAVPGVREIASAMQEPLGDDVSPIEIRHPGETESQSRIAELNTVSEDYFSVLGLPIVRGRTFTPQEVREPALEPRPVIVTETTARNIWRGGDPIGQTLVSGLGNLIVVGVAADAQVSALGEVDPYYVYAPGGGSLFVKSQASSAETIAAIHAAARAIDPTLVLTVLPLEATVGWSRGISGTVTAVFGGLGVMALVLACVGIYGVVSYAVAGRYREIGVRLALGATPSNVLALIVRQTMRPVVVGAAIGVAAAAATSRVLTSVLFGVSPVDPVGLAGAVALVLGAALVAGLLAARPVTAADPTSALRAE